MKNLILAFVLSIFSIQGNAQCCRYINIKVKVIEPSTKTIVYSPGKLYYKIRIYNPGFDTIRPIDSFFYYINRSRNFGADIYQSFKYRFTSPVAKGDSIDIIGNFNIKASRCQKQKDKPIEFSFFYSAYFSYSKLKVKQPDIYSHAYFNSSDFGLKIQRKLTLKYPKLLICAMYGGANLSVSGKSEFTVSPDSLKPGQYQTSAVLNKTILPRYRYLGIGLKKLVKESKQFSFNIEGGGKLFIKLNSDEPNISDITPINNDRFIFRTFEFEKKRKYTILPYLAVGMDYKVGWFKFGIQLWAQNSFTNMYQYNYKLKYGSLYFESKLHSTGFAWGTNIYVKLFTL